MDIGHQQGRRRAMEGGALRQKIKRLAGQLDASRTRRKGLSESTHHHTCLITHH
jgi:hypothetical protein